MAHVVLLNVVFFVPATCGALAFAILVFRVVLASGTPPAPPGPDGGAKLPVTSAGPNDLARSA